MNNRLKRSNRSINVPNAPIVPDVPAEVRSFRTLERSFTLIELLVATFIFVMLITVGMAAMTVMWHSKSKLSGSKTVQESARLSMETMANAVKSSNGTGNVGGKNYQQFAVVGPELTVFQDTVTKKFHLNGMVLEEQITNGAYTSPWSPLNSPDVNVTGLSFSGQDGIQPPPNPGVQPYVTIEMTVQTTNQTDVNKKDSGTFRTTVVPGGSFSFSQRNVLKEGLPYIFMPMTNCSSDGEMTLNDVNKDLTIHDTQTLDIFGKCTGNLNIASDGKYLYLTYEVSGFGVTGGSQWKFNNGIWEIVGNINVPNAAHLFDTAADSKYLYSFSHDAEFLCRIDTTSHTQVCATDASTGLSIKEKDVDTAINKAGMAAMEDSSGNHFVYLTNSDPPVGTNPWIAKINVTDSNSNNWQVISFKNTSGMPTAVGITYDKKDGNVWTVGPGGLCKWPSDLTSSVPTCVKTIGGINITKGVDVSTDDNAIYIAGVEIESTTTHKGVIKVLKSDLTKIAAQNLSLKIQRLAGDIGWQYYWVYE